MWISLAPWNAGISRNNAGLARRERGLLRVLWSCGVHAGRHLYGHRISLIYAAIKAQHHQTPVIDAYNVKSKFGASRQSKVRQRQATWAEDVDAQLFTVNAEGKTNTASSVEGLARAPTLRSR